MSSDPNPFAITFTYGEGPQPLLPLQPPEYVSTIHSLRDPNGPPVDVAYQEDGNGIDGVGFYLKGTLKGEPIRQWSEEELTDPPKPRRRRTQKAKR